MSYAIKILDIEEFKRTGNIGSSYLLNFDPSYRFPIGKATMTRDPNKAKPFPTFEAAFEYWRQTVGDAPRADGKPNRPLTAFSIEIVEIVNGVEVNRA